MPAGATAVCFYVALAAGVAAAISVARRAVERRPVPRLTLGLAALAVVGLAASVVSYASGPRDVLPF